MFALAFSFVTSALSAQGLVPFSPPPGAQVFPDLRESPDSLSPLLRTIESTDKVYVLRSQSPTESPSGLLSAWYEVDVLTIDNLSFRGWVRADWPKPASVDIPTKRLPTPRPQDPWESTRWRWLWSPTLSDRIELSFSGGFMQTGYSLSGVVNGTRASIYSYQFSGFNLGPEVRIKIFEWAHKSFDLDTTFRGRYDYGLFGLSFDAAFEVPEVAGRAYELSTHTYRADARIRVWPKLPNPKIRLGISLGAGFWLHEVLPDLERITTGAFQGQSIFVDTTMKALAIPIELEAHWTDAWRARLGGSLFFLAGMNESAAQTPNLSSSGFPFLLTGSVSWAFARSYAATLGGEYFRANGSSSGTGTRLSATYTDGRIRLHSLRLLGSFDLRF